MNKKSHLINGSTELYLDSRTWNIRQNVLTWLSWLQKWRQKVKTRKQLANLPAYLLRDIGLTDQQIRDESRKKFWQ